MPLVQSPPGAWSAKIAVTTPAGPTSVFVTSPGCASASQTWQWLLGMYGDLLLGASLYGPGQFVSLTDSTIVKGAS